ncbi:alpha-hydroxy-acid oxidizing protein [Dermacoccaceae bacterium W4C1]
MSLGRQVQNRIYRAGVFGRTPSVPVEPSRLQEAARKAMSPEAYAYVAGGAGQQRTVAANASAFGKYRIRPRMLVNVEQRDLGIDLLGRHLSSPVLLAPIGVLEMADPQAEHAVARAAQTTNTPMILSTQASVPMEDTAASLGETPRIFQLYWSRNEDLVASFLQRAEAIGADAVMVTLDTHVLGWRTMDLDLGYLPFARAQGIAQYLSDPVFQQLVATRPTSTESTPRPTPAAVKALVSMAQHYPGSLRDNLRSPLPRAAVDTFLEVFSRSDLTWDDLDRLRGMTSLPILVKGIQDPADAQRALDAGVDGIVVSNHGGRQVDNAVASLDMLPQVAKVVDAQVPVLFDSGIRSGADVLVALALGADAVLLGRPYVYGLALGGETGVREVIENVLGDLDLTMALTGASRISEITSELLEIS